MSLNDCFFRLFAAATLMNCLYISLCIYYAYTLLHVIYFQPRRPPMVRKQGGMSICQIKIPNSFLSLHVAQAFPTSRHMGWASLLRNFCQISRSCLRDSQVAWWMMVPVYGLYRLYVYDSWLKLALVRRWGCGGVLHVTQLVEDSWFRTLVKYFDYKTFVLLFKTPFRFLPPTS